MSATCQEPRYMQLVDRVNMIWRWVHPPKTDMNKKYGKVGSPKKAAKVIKDQPYREGII